MSGPRGIHPFCTGWCTCVHNRVIMMEELEDGSRMSLGQIRGVHNDSMFILESPSRHPHAATPSQQAIRRESTESTAPTTTSVLLLEISLLKQAVWKVGSGRIGKTELRPQPRIDGKEKTTKRSDTLRRRTSRGHRAAPESVSRIRRTGRGGVVGRLVRGYGLVSVACVTLL